MKNEIEKYAEIIVKNISLLTILTFILGYVGFQTFRAIYQLPIIFTDISIIAAIGLLNLAFLGILFLISSKKRKPRYFEALLVCLIFYFSLQDPIKIVSILVFQFIIRSFTIDNSPKKRGYSEEKKTVKTYRKLMLILEVATILFSLCFSIFIDSDFLNLLIAIYVILYFLYKYKKYKEKPNYIIYLFVIIFPVITMYHFINSSKTNLIGLNTQKVKLITQKDTLNTEIVYSDEKYFYTFSDSSRLLTSIRKDDVNLITNQTNKKVSKNFLEVIKETWNDLYKKNK